MSSQTNIAHTSFLEDCIDKKRTLQDVYEALGLYSQTAGTRKDPVFMKDEANELHESIKEMAQSFKAAYRNDRERLLADLVKEDTFADQVQELEQSYGRLLWGRSKDWPSRYRGQGVSPDELDWDRDADRDSIRFHIRCWITRVAVQTLPNKGKSKGKGKGKASTVVTIDLSDSEYSDAELVRTPPRPNTTASSELPIRAPEAPSMLPPAERCQAEPATTQERSAPVDVVPMAGPRSPLTPNKRKALSHPGQPASGKLQKVMKDVQPSTGSPRGRQREVCSVSVRDGYSIPVSPAPNFPTLSNVLPQRGQREDTCDTDRTWAPGTEGTVETETAVDFDEFMVDAQDSTLDTRTMNDKHNSQVLRSPTAGPSGTYRNPRRQDSVIPLSTQEDIDHPEVVDTIIRSFTAPNAIEGTDRTTAAPGPHTEVSKLNNWQKKQLRLELFKLLLSFLNGINHFNAGSYQFEAEESMNHLLKEFWSYDSDSIRSRVGARFAELQTVWDCWMNMRLLLAAFQRTTGYFGRPGDDWKEYLKRMERVARARASIAFVNMKSFGTTEDSAKNIDPRFDDDLATIFDLLTQVEGCNGVDEFGAIQAYNREIWVWFS